MKTYSEKDAVRHSKINAFVRPGFVWIAAIAVLLVGCDARKGAGPRRSGGVAVIDLDAIAKRLGRDETIISEIKGTSETLSEKITATQNELQQKFDQQRQALGPSPSDDDKQKLAQLQEQLSAELQNKQQEAQNELNKKRASVISRFQEEVRPVARAIAAERGLEVILAKGDGAIFSAEPSSDITDAVVAKMVTSQAAASAAPAPAAPAPAAPAGAAPSPASNTP